MSTRSTRSTEFTKPIKKKLADRLGQLRTGLDLTQEKAAALCGVEPRTYENWEGKTKLPSAENLLRLHIFMGLDVNKLAGDIFGGKGEENQD